MARRRNGSTFAKWGIIGGAIAGGAALISLIPAAKKRGMRVTSILKKDHRMVSGLIAALQVAPRIHGMVRKTLLDQIHNSLMMHTQAEEEILYPAMRNFMLTNGESTVDESYREHEQIKSLLSELSRMDTISDAFDRKVVELKSSIQHHVQEEENEMFVILMQRMSTEQQQELGRRIHERKMHLRTRMAA
jgi:hemerythrin superfamily protein